MEPTPFTPGQSYVYNGQTIPSQQTLAPATAPEIAFRPACSQLGEVLQANGTMAYTLNLPSGGVKIMAEFNRGDVASRQQAEFEMGAMGACKIGGAPVPVVYLDQLPQPAITSPTVPVDSAGQFPTETSSGAGPNGLLVGGGVLIVLASLAGIGWLIFTAKKQKPLAKTSGPSPLEQLISLAKDGDQ